MIIQRACLRTGSYDIYYYGPNAAYPWVIDVRLQDYSNKNIFITKDYTKEEVYIILENFIEEILGKAAQTRCATIG